jgi:hypothetical protein
MTAKFPDQSFFFASWHRPRDIRSLSDLLISQFHSLNSRNPRIMCVALNKFFFLFN